MDSGFSGIATPEAVDIAPRELKRRSGGQTDKSVARADKAARANVRAARCGALVVETGMLPVRFGSVGSTWAHAGRRGEGLRGLRGRGQFRPRRDNERAGRWERERCCFCRKCGFWRTGMWAGGRQFRKWRDADRDGCDCRFCRKWRCAGREFGPGWDAFECGGLLNRADAIAVFAGIRERRDIRCGEVAAVFAGNGGRRLPSLPETRVGDGEGTAAGTNLRAKALAKGRRGIDGIGGIGGASGVRGMQGMQGVTNVHRAADARRMGSGGGVSDMSDMSCIRGICGIRGIRCTCGTGGIGVSRGWRRNGSGRRK